MFGLSEETQTKIGYGLIVVGVAAGGYALYKNMSKPSSKKAVGLGKCSRRKGKSNKGSKKKRK